MIRQKLLTLLGLSLLAGALAAPNAGAINVFDACNGDNRDTAVCEAQQNETDDGKQFMKNIVNTLMMLLGSVCIVMMVIGGFRYVVSNGEQQQITSAKNTILYAAIGLIVALFASVAVNFIIEQFV